MVTEQETKIAVETSSPSALEPIYETAMLDLNGGLLVVNDGQCRIIMNERLTSEEQAQGRIYFQRYLSELCVDTRAVYIWCLDPEPEE